MSPAPQEPIVGTFTSLVRRSLPPVGAFGSAILGVPRVLDEMITSGSVRNARDAVTETERKREIGKALDDLRSDMSPPDVGLFQGPRSSTR